MNRVGKIVLGVLVSFPALALLALAVLMPTAHSIIVAALGAAVSAIAALVYWGVSANGRKTAPNK